jgi:hypothetical protein
MQPKCNRFLMLFDYSGFGTKGAEAVNTSTAGDRPFPSRTRQRILDVIRANPDLSPYDVAEQLKIHVQTVKKAYHWLASRGYGRIIAARGRGNMLRFIPLELTAL